MPLPALALFDPDRRRRNRGETTRGETRPGARPGPGPGEDERIRKVVVQCTMMPKNRVSECGARNLSFPRK